MTAEEALAALKEARDNGDGWLRIAEILDQVRNSDVGGRAGKLSVAFIEEAAEASRYAPGILRRMSAARTFLAEFDQAHPELGFRDHLGGSTAQFSKLELFARLHKVAPEKALEIAGAVADGSLTQKALDLIYREASGRPLPGYRNQGPLFGSAPTFPTAGSAGKLRKPGKIFPTPFHEACWEALKKDVAKLSGEGDVRLSCDYRFTYFVPFAVAVGVRDFGIEFVDGFYPALLATVPSRAQMNRALKEVAFQAPFFRRLWIFVPSGSAAKMCEELAVSGLGAVGCVEVRGGLLTIKQTSAGMTAVRQQARLAAEVLEIGVPRR